MPSNLLLYEKDNNLLLKALRDNTEYTKLLNMASNRNLIILVPATVTLEGMKITPAFMETHLIATNPLKTSQFVAVNGIRGVFSSMRDSLTVLSSPPPQEESFKFFQETVELFPPGLTLYDEDHSHLHQSHNVHLLRESELDIGERRAVPFILISEPLFYEGCPWHPAMAASSEMSAIASDHAGGDGTDGMVATDPAQPSVPRRIRDFLNIFGNTTGSAGADGAVLPEDSVKEGEGMTAGPVNTLTYRDFLDKLRQPAAADVVNAMKTFIENFQKKSQQAEQHKKVRQFLDHMEETIQRHVLWEHCTDDEIENAREGLEKLLMTRIHSRAFKPDPSYAETDAKIYKRLASLQFVTLDNLDIAPNLHNDVSHLLAQKELQKINHYKAPRDKMVCILNCCKVISNLLTHAREGQPYGADEFLPLLIYITLKANPEDLHSNIQYIQNYRHPSKLAAESGYYFMQLVSAVHFLEMMESTSLSIDPAEYERLIVEGEQGVLPKSSDTVSTVPDAAASRDSEIGDHKAINISDGAMECLVRSYRYMGLEANDIRVGDVPELLKDYKVLVEVLKHIVEEQGQRL